MRSQAHTRVCQVLAGVCWLAGECSWIVTQLCARASLHVYVFSTGCVQQQPIFSRDRLSCPLNYSSAPFYGVVHYIAPHPHILPV